VYCSRCGNPVPAGATYCEICGLAVPSPKKAEVQVGQPIPPSTLRGTESTLVKSQPSSSSAPFGIEPTTGLPYSSRSKVAAGLLQIFLGGLGIGRFYTGHVGIAIAQIVVTLITCGLGAIWPLIDGIMMLVGNPKDADGRPMRS
jgi:TM2 domain-containing membrane protein YozV